ncbi:tRNA glutamyl-Q(34) synthetase GluQRS [Teredinibacter sp. KSP-S5-2]|uniref:tRNA glutamyl-Q(34) synthetase GluQRS n=1 Tax=Teredinibacter sp. KSP-S5-2 TaxID=3034506 RepID=UPI002934C64D|nr:tRNA glutamyl-Q(34) synthetase GluQRS [Teredinibacter sp. KSP-S5-2]WNO09469.1 tRNA glutamyl-Q(34) synthetase GluQRS [Teredinibacter sp. KSP-S5-2]
MGTLSPYIGRFAPSPSGPLHTGSILCALASYLDAKANAGTWLVRMEDIDPPREEPGAKERILKTLQQHSLCWDGEILYQSTRSSAYTEALTNLKAKQLGYHCDCNRKRLLSINHIYDGHCRNRDILQQLPYSIRLNCDNAVHQYGLPPEITFKDAIQGVQKENVLEQGDFVIHRKDGLFAYQLAVVVDDIYQGITHIVRGADLLDTTAKQIFLTKLLQGQAINYGHIPVIVDSTGAKLSKQNHAPAVNDETPQANLLQVAKLLGLDCSRLSTQHSTREILTSLIAQWSIKNIPRQRSIAYESIQ